MSGLSVLRPFEKSKPSGLGPCEKELFLGSKVSGVCLCSFKRVGKDKAASDHLGFPSRALWIVPIGLSVTLKSELVRKVNRIQVLLVLA